MLCRVCGASSACSVLFDSLHVFEQRDTTDRDLHGRDDLIVRQMREPDAFDEISIPAPVAATETTCPGSPLMLLTLKTTPSRLVTCRLLELTMSEADT
jgi:hypothetical protein